MPGTLRSAWQGPLFPARSAPRLFNCLRAKMLPHEGEPQGYVSPFVPLRPREGGFETAFEPRQVHQGHAAGLLCPHDVASLHRTTSAVALRDHISSSAFVLG